MKRSSEHRIASASKIELKPVFVERYKELLGERYGAFMDASFTYLRKCIRVNTLKISVERLQQKLEGQGWILTPIPWCKEGFFVEGHKTQDRYDVGNLVEHTLGYFYVQEAASMIPPIALFNGDIKPTIDGQLRVLDMCAAPGSKTTQLAQYMNNEGLLVANDLSIGRLRPLSMNLQRMGVYNTLVTLNAFQRSKNNMKFFNPLEEPPFDAILLDAPCSGTGTIRKSFKTLEMYSQNLVARMEGTQKALIKNAWQLLKPGGILIYSTCTVEPQENESIITHLLERVDDAQIIPLDLDITRSEPILEWQGQKYHDDCKHCLRIYPQDNDSEGFFVTKIRKSLQND
jgi:NOL1/NOP2/sun family putative RNA methylase